MDEFERGLDEQTPRLRSYALALTRKARRDDSLADDLVQNTLERALAKRHLWQEGANLPGWLSTILYRQYVNDVRKSVREGTSVSVEVVAPVLLVEARQEEGLKLRDLKRAFATLTRGQQQVVLLVGVDGLPYEEVALKLGIPVGTVRSRLTRGRVALREKVGRGAEEYIAA